MLMGIVTKNAIMLVDFAVERVRHGMTREAAILDSGAKRARPIVMTTIAMSAGMLPAALAIGDGGEFRAPMAIAVIGGLLVSTVLSLVFVPAVYTIMDDVARGSSWLIRKILNPNRKEDEAEDMFAAHRSTPVAANESEPARLAASRVLQFKAANARRRQKKELAQSLRTIPPAMKACIWHKAVCEKLSPYWR
jgi:predicted RND superfamily exporter protein